MIKKKFQKYLIDESFSLEQALDKINSLKEKILFIIKNKTVSGIVTEGDVFRALNNGSPFSTNIKKFMNKNFQYFKSKNDFFLNYYQKIRPDKLHIPIIKNKKLVEIIFYNQVVKFLEKRIKNNQKIIFILIMAGGYGKRMRPISKIIPKPLLQNNQGEPILVNTIKKFHSLNKNSNIYVSLFYKNAIIKKILKKNINFKLNYINERVPLGTIGCLKEMQNKIQDNIMVINCDTLINFNPNIVYDFHLKSNNDLTIVSSVEKFRLDYGILFFNKNNRVKNFLEKPENEYNLNVGLYIFKKKVIKLIGNEEKLDFPQLLRRCLKKKLNVKLFPVQSFMWNDIGNPKNYRSYLKNN